MATPHKSHLSSLSVSLPLSCRSHLVFPLAAVETILPDSPHLSLSPVLLRFFKQWWLFKVSVEHQYHIIICCPPSPPKLLI